MGCGPERELRGEVASGRKLVVSSRTSTSERRDERKISAPNPCHQFSPRRSEIALELEHSLQQLSQRPPIDPLTATGRCLSPEIDRLEHSDAFPTLVSQAFFR